MDTVTFVRALTVRNSGAVLLPLTRSANAMQDAANDGLLVIVQLLGVVKGAGDAIPELSPANIDTLFVLAQLTE